MTDRSEITETRRKELRSMNPKSIQTPEELLQAWHHQKHTPPSAGGNDEDTDESEPNQPAQY